MEEGKKKCTACLETKPLGEFVKSSQYKDGRTPKCKVCLLKRVKEKRLGGVKYRKIKEISETDRIFYELGIFKGEEGLNDIKKALAIEQRANRALMEVINDADRRDRNAKFGG